jgi:hypothetical protein
MRGPERRSNRQERGIALGVALFALIVLGGMISGSFYLGIVEQQSGRNTLFAVQAAEAAEAQLRQAVRTTAVSTVLALPIGGPPLELDSIALDPNVTARGNVARLGTNLFLIRSRGTRLDADGRALATRTLGLLVRSTRDSLEGTDVVTPIEQRAWLQLY